MTEEFEYDFRSHKLSIICFCSIFLCGALILSLSLIFPFFGITDVFDDGYEIENHHDILLMKYNSSGTQLWAITWGWNNSFEDGHDLIIDKENNIIIVGRSNGFNTSTNYGVCLLKFNSSGAMLWNVSWGDVERIYYPYKVFAMAVDNESNILITGYISYSKSFVAKFNPDGDHIWNITHKGVIYRDIFVDNKSFLYVTGAYNNDTIISKYSTNGTQIWNTTWGGVNMDDGFGINLDSNENIYITGFTASFGNGTIDAFVVKYYPNGTQLWNTTWGGTLYDNGKCIAIDNEDNIYVPIHSYKYRANTSFNLVESDVFIIKFYPNGTQAWQTQWGRSHHDFVYDIVVDDMNNIYITGASMLDLGNLSHDYYLLKYNSEGDFIWSDIANGSADRNDSKGWGIALDNESNIFISGYIQRR